jgi:hypothetical protein
MINRRSMPDESEINVVEHDSSGVPEQRPTIGDEICLNNLAAEYRRSADQCCRKAEASTNDSDAAYWLKISEIWLKLAQETEPHCTRGSPVV